MSNYIYQENNTASFYTMAWIGFVLSFIGMAVGVIYIETDLAVKGFIAMTYLFSVTSCFTVAKVVRDRHESTKFVKKVEQAKTEKFLSEHGNI